jgi:soluble epoxide hydrolase/lipid-phosphate phosphatase
MHGWPSLWASWKYQIEEFEVCGASLLSKILTFPHCGLQSDYRLIVPTIRGYGASTHPGDVQTSGSLPDLVGDIMCILGHAGVSQAIAIGQVTRSSAFRSSD